MFRPAISFLIFCISVSFTLTSNAAIYQYKDDEANITYSDELSDGGKRVKENKPSVAPNSVPVKKTIRKTPIAKKPVPPTAKTKKALTKENAKAKPYTLVKVSNPEHDKAIRRNNGDVEVSALITPALQTKFGHKIQLVFDGKKMPDQWKSSSILLKALDRGSHTVSIIIVDRTGKTLKQSKPVTFHLQRFSLLIGK